MQFGWFGVGDPDIAQLFCSFSLGSEAGAIKCQLSYVVLPVLDIRAAREAGAARKPKAKSRAKAGAKAKRKRPCYGRNKPVQRAWILLPAYVAAVPDFFFPDQDRWPGGTPF